MKSDTYIKDLVYQIVRNSVLPENVNGVLSKTIRPSDSNNEDIVISILDGSNGQLQSFIVNVNVYVHDANKEKDHIEDTSRIRVLSEICINLFESIIGDDYRIELEKQRILSVPDKEEHLINNRILVTIFNS
ncbi:MAG: hypothetical protein PHH23_01725 [Paludibacteraceae bacterium]|nr:hypothetical protein [Paludibacteraceae bacterium]